MLVLNVSSWDREVAGAGKERHRPSRARGKRLIVSRDGDLGIQDRADPAEGLRQKK